MTTDTADADDRLPTTGPDDAVYEDYELTTTADGQVRLSLANDDEAWIEADDAVALDEWE